MSTQFPWKRFWCRREDSYSLADRGFSVDPEAKHRNILNPALTTLDQLQGVPCLALLGEPGVGKGWSVSVDVDAFLQEKADLKVIRLDLRNFGSEDRLFRALFEHLTFLQWSTGDDELHLYLDSFDECLLRIETVAAQRTLQDGRPCCGAARNPCFVQQRACRYDLAGAGEEEPYDFYLATEKA